MSENFVGTQLLSTITKTELLRLELVEGVVGSPGPDEVIIQVEASPINPSDLAVLVGPADLSRADAGGTAGAPTITAPIPSAAMSGVKQRLDMAQLPGNEGAGTVVAAGRDAQHLLSQRVAVRAGGMYAQYRKVEAQQCVVLPPGVSAAEGASIFINPLTALCFIETMKQEGHTAIVHFAAASNLGQMLNRICLKDGIPLVNIVRSAPQAELLRREGAVHVLDSTADDFQLQLVEAIAATSATLAFDPIGGGRQASQALSAMEKVANRRSDAFDVYGSGIYKQVYVYGALNRSPLIHDQWVAFAWGIGGWLLTYRMRQLGAEGAARLQARILDELTTTFATAYTRTLSLPEVLQPEHLRAYTRRATGEKYLVTPHA